MRELWLLSRVCEEFHCLPDEGERLVMDDPAHRAIDIIELRAYAQAKAAFDGVGGKLDQLEQSPLMDLVIQHDARRVLRGAR